MKYVPKARFAVVTSIFIAAMVCAPLGRLSAAQWKPELTKIIEGAKRENQLKLMWGEGTLGGSKGAKMFQASMNKLFGTNLVISFSPGPSMPQLGSQITTEYAAGQKAVSDVYIGADSYLGALVQRQIFLAVDWPALLPQRIKPDMAEGNHTTLKVYSGLPGVPYNTRLIPGSEVPRTLKDFLGPEWKGKVASTPYALSLNILAADEMWGRDKALDYVKKLSKQISGMIRCNETERVASGEFLALIMDCSGADAFALKEKGAPVDLLIPADGAMIRYRYLAIPKNAEHPNAAKLFTVFMMMEEAQRLLWEFSKQDLHLFPESNIGRKVRLLEKQGVKFFVPSLEWSVKHPEIEQIRGEMEKILRSGEK